MTVRADFEGLGALERMVYMRDVVTGLCAAIDAGDVVPGEEEMLALAIVVEQHAGPLTHDLVCQLASRCRHGRKVLNEMDRASRRTSASSSVDQRPTAAGCGSLAIDPQAQRHARPSTRGKKSSSSSRRKSG